MIRKILVVMGLAAVVCAYGARGKAAEEEKVDPLVFVCQDESCIENQVRKYIKAKDDIRAQFKYFNGNEDDIMLVYHLSPADTPKIPITVDTLVSRKQDGQVMERAVKLTAVYEIPAKFKNDEIKHKIMQLNNDFMAGSWIPHRVRLDKDMDLVLECYVNIPAPHIPIHAEMVYDLLVRNISAWKKYYQELSTILQ